MSERPTPKPCQPVPATSAERERITRALLAAAEASPYRDERVVAQYRAQLGLKQEKQV